MYAILLHPDGNENVPPQLVAAGMQDIDEAECTASLINIWKGVPLSRLEVIYKEMEVEEGAR